MVTRGDPVLFHRIVVFLLDDIKKKADELVSYIEGYDLDSDAPKEVKDAFKTFVENESIEELFKVARVIRAAA